MSCCCEPRPCSVARPPLRPPSCALAPPPRPPRPGAWRLSGRRGPGHRTAWTLARSWPGGCARLQQGRAGLCSRQGGRGMREGWLRCVPPCSLPRSPCSCARTIPRLRLVGAGRQVVDGEHVRLRLHQEELLRAGRSCRRSSGSGGGGGRRLGRLAAGPPLPLGRRLLHLLLLNMLLRWRLLGRRLGRLCSALQEQRAAEAAETGLIIVAQCTHHDAIDKTTGSAPWEPCRCRAGH